MPKKKLPPLKLEITISVICAYESYDAPRVIKTLEDAIYKSLILGAEPEIVIVSGKA
jgi:hypothetical protein